MHIKGTNIRFKLPTRYLPHLPRTAIRFFIVGTTGMLIQTGVFKASLMAFGHPGGEEFLYYLAFTLGYLFEMVPNYVLSNWYTFGTRPKWKNAGGFVFARIINYPLQIGLLPVYKALFPTWEDDYISFLVIFTAGCANYLICLLFFKNKKKE